MKSKSKLLFLFMAFALTFVFAINVKAGCSAGSGMGTQACDGISCSQTTYSACVSAGGSSAKCCAWTDPTCTGNTTLVNHECVEVEPETPTSCPAGQELNTAGTACVTCRSGYYKSGTGIACSYCDGTVNSSHTSCTPRATNVTVSISAGQTTLGPGESTTLSVSKDPSSVSGDITCSGGSNGCSSFTCPSEGNGGVYTITATMTCSNCNVTNGSVVITCNPAEGNAVASIKAQPTTLYVSPSSPAGLNLTAYDAEGRGVKADWTGSSHISASCSNTISCGATVTAEKCRTITETVSASGSGNNTGSASATITIVGYADWSRSSGKVQVPQDKRGHTRHEAEVAEDQENRCVAYEEVDPALGIGYRYDRCCGGGTTELPYCYQKQDGSREVTTYQEGYVKKDDKYCEKACYKKSDNTYAKTWYEDGYTKVEDRYCDSTPTPHCYKTPEGKYVKEVYKEGYVQVDDEYCEAACFKKPDGTVEKTTYQEGYERMDDSYCEPACYKTGEDTYEKVIYKEGYTKVEDKYCEMACYKIEEDKYEKTYYRDGYELVEDDKCATVPPTGATVSKIIYALSLFLVMAGSGIVVYQLTKTKKELGE